MFRFQVDKVAFVLTIVDKMLSFVALALTTVDKMFWFQEDKAAFGLTIVGKRFLGSR